MYDQKKPLLPWLSTIISHQISNLLRNFYSNFSRPCLKCEAAREQNSCDIYGTQCESCPAYAHWKKTKSSACDIRLPVTLEKHSQEVYNLPTENNDIEIATENLHIKMREVLKASEYRFYNLYCIQKKKEDEIAKILGFKTNEQGRKAGYKRIKQLKEIILTKVKKLVYSGEIDF